MSWYHTYRMTSCEIVRFVADRSRNWSLILYIPRSMYRLWELKVVKKYEMNCIVHIINILFYNYYASNCYHNENINL